MRWLAFGLLLTLATTAHAEEATERSPKEVLECMRRNAPDDTLVQTVELVTVDRTGAERSQSGRLYVKRFPDGLGRALLRVEAPPDLRGSAVLAIQEEDRTEMFVYLPEYRRVRRIHTSSLRGRMLGSDFTYEEVEHLFAFTKIAEMRMVGAEPVEGRAVYAIESEPGPDAQSAYSRIVSHVDRETCIPLRIDFFDGGTEAAKVLSADPEHVSLEGSVHVPRLVTMRDVQRGTESRLVTHAVEIDARISRRLFTQAELGKGR